MNHPPVSRRQALGLIATTTSLPLPSQTGTTLGHHRGAGAGPEGVLQRLGRRRPHQRVHPVGGGRSQPPPWRAGRAREADRHSGSREARSEKGRWQAQRGTVDAGWDQWRELPHHEARRPAVWPVCREPARFPVCRCHRQADDAYGLFEPVDGLEAPWGMAQFTLYADRKRVPSPPRSMAALADFARANPGA